MTKFLGYIAMAVDTVDGAVLQNYDLTLQQWQDRFGLVGLEAVPPLCPLAVAGHVAEDYASGIAAGNVKVLVIDQVRGTVETYDQAKIDFELEIERLAG